MDALRFSEVGKVFVTSKGPFTALSNLNLSIPEGSIFGLLGPNGAGKSTAINLLSGILLPTSGQVQVFGHDVADETVTTKSLIGVVPQEIVVEMAFTVEEVLYYFSGLYGVSAADRRERIPQILADLDLADKAKERARSLSGGMKRRLMIAKALIHRPKLLVLDEPTAGVDVALRQKIWELVRRLNQNGTTILFTTHYLEEAEALCESIAVINKGQLIKTGKLSDIQKEFSQNTIAFKLFDRNVEHLPGIIPVGEEFQLSLTDLAIDTARVTSHYGANLKSLHTDTASLESIFLKLTGNV